MSTLDDMTYDSFKIRTHQFNALVRVGLFCGPDAIFHCLLYVCKKFSRQSCAATLDYIVPKDDYDFSAWVVLRQDYVTPMTFFLKAYRVWSKMADLHLARIKGL